MRMYAVKPLDNTQVCVKIIKGDKVISIAFDDSCGALQNLGRVELCVFTKGSSTPDYTVPRPDIEDLRNALDWLEE